MAIIIYEGYRQTAEVGFCRKDPDVFATFFAAELVSHLAQAIAPESLETFRADVNVQVVKATKRVKRSTPIRINVVGNIHASNSIDLEEISRATALSLLDRAGYLMHGDFEGGNLIINTEGVIRESSIDIEEAKNIFTDSCTVIGHAIRAPYGKSGTFSSLIIAQEVDRFVDTLLREEDLGLRPDGKAYITVKYGKDGISLEQVALSLSHKQGNNLSAFRKEIGERIAQEFKRYRLKRENTLVNEGGPFDRYFVQASTGVSKAKDGVIITGGNTGIGTDSFWGKCMYKASSILFPAAFAVSNVVCELTGAKYASVRGSVLYGYERATFVLEQIDPECERQRYAINRAMEILPRSPAELRKMLDLPVSIGSYRQLNDVAGFHDVDVCGSMGVILRKGKSWKRLIPAIYNTVESEYKFHRMR